MRSITLRGPDGRETILNAFGFQTIGPDGSFLKAFIDRDHMPTFVLGNKGARLGMGVKERPVINAACRGESSIFSSRGVNFDAGRWRAGLDASGFVVNDGNREQVTLTTEGVGYLARLQRDGLLTIPLFVHRPSRVRRLLARVGTLLGFRGSVDADDDGPSVIKLPSA